MEPGTRVLSRTTAELCRGPTLLNVIYDVVLGLVSPAKAKLVANSDGMFMKIAISLTRFTLNCRGSTLARRRLLVEVLQCIILYAVPI